MTSPLFDLLTRVAWQYYVTLTFGSNWNGKKSRNAIERLFKFLRQVALAHRGSRNLKDWDWLVCEEEGEIDQRFHYHLLLAGLQPATLTHCYAMAHLWRVVCRGGWAIVRPYDPALAGVDYVLKTVSAADLRVASELESDEDKLKVVSGVNYGVHRSYEEANRYEVAKIGVGEGALCASTVTLSRKLRMTLSGSRDSAQRRLNRDGRDKYRHWRGRETRSEHRLP